MLCAKGLHSLGEGCRTALTNAHDHTHPHNTPVRVAASSDGAAAAWQQQQEQRKRKGMQRRQEVDVGGQASQNDPWVASGLPGAQQRQWPRVDQGRDRWAVQSGAYAQQQEGTGPLNQRIMACTSLHELHSIAVYHQCWLLERGAVHQVCEHKCGVCSLSLPALQ